MVDSGAEKSGGSDKTTKSPGGEKAYVIPRAYWPWVVRSVYFVFVPLLAFFLGTFVSVVDVVINPRIEGFEERFVTQINDFKESVGTRIEDFKASVNARLDGMQTDIDSIEESVTALQQDPQSPDGTNSQTNAQVVEDPETTRL